MVPRRTTPGRRDVAHWTGGTPPRRRGPGIKQTRLPSGPASLLETLVSPATSGTRNVRPCGPVITEAETAGLPASIAADLLEAATCGAAGAHRAAALMARRAVEQVVVMCGVPLEAKTLNQKLVWLLKAGHLPGHLAGDARTVRDVGNAAAHGGATLTRDEAEAVIVAALAVARGALTRSV